jgi:multiple sugar transport system substrate-binding protein
LHDLYKHGGDVIRGQFAGADPGKDLKPILNNDKGIAATKFFKEEEKYMPPGVGTYEFFEALQVFMSGKTAMVFYWNDGANITEDPSQSAVAGKVGFALNPAFNGNRTAFLGGWGATMSADSKNKKLAFEYMKWVYGKKNAKRFTLAGAQPPRISIFKDPELQKKFPWFEATLKQLPYTRPYPLFVEWPQMQDIIGENLSMIYTNEKSVADGLNDSATRIDKVMQQAGYYNK